MYKVISGKPPTEEKHEGGEREEEGKRAHRVVQVAA